MLNLSQELMIGYDLLSAPWSKSVLIPISYIIGNEVAFRVHRYTVFQIKEKIIFCIKESCKCD